MTDYEQARHNMISQQLRCTGVLAQNVLDLMDEIPREDFVPSKYKGLSYADTCIDLGHGQVMLQPKEQGSIIQALAIKPSDKILEIGTGYGYLTALLARLGQYVHSIEIFLDFTDKSQQNLNHINIDNVQLITDDANSCWDKFGPYDVICCTAGLAFYPEAFKKGLNVGGRLFAIYGTEPSMQATVITRGEEETWSEETIFETMIPVMINTPVPESFKL